MKSRSFAAACLLVTAFGGANAAELLDATQPEKILAVASGFGSATLERDSDGDPLIIGRIEGSKYGIFFYGCTDGADCQDIQFHAAWGGVETSLEELNEWNRSMRFGTAYLDGENDPALQMTVNLDFGVSPLNLDDTFAWWARAMKDFRQEILKQ
jgi:hypothetical protein